MTVIIDEIIASVETPAAESLDSEPRPSEAQQQLNLFDLLELAQERKARLVID